MEYITFQQGGVAWHTSQAALDLLHEKSEGRIISLPVTLSGPRIKQFQHIDFFVGMS